MMRWFALVWLLAVAPVLAADDIDREVRRIEAALTRISQEQQSVYQQFQMVQEMRRSEERQMPPLQSYTPPATPPNYDDVKREEETRAERIKEYQYELDRLYARYRELEEQKKPLLEELSALAQLRNDEH
jgi:predicted  nucleic acid-binding Zn-ribbon protein